MEAAGGRRSGMLMASAPLKDHAHARVCLPALGAPHVHLADQACRSLPSTSERVRIHFMLDQRVMAMIGDQQETMRTETFVESLLDTDCFSNVKANRWILGRTPLGRDEHVWRQKDQVEVCSSTDDVDGFGTLVYHEHYLDVLPDGVFAKCEWYTTRLTLSDLLWVDVVSWWANGRSWVYTVCTCDCELLPRQQLCGALDGQVGLLPSRALVLLRSCGEDFFGCAPLSVAERVGVCISDGVIREKPPEELGDVFYCSEAFINKAIEGLLESSDEGEEDTTDDADEGEEETTDDERGHQGRGKNDDTSEVPRWASIFSTK
eukprot:TRINITY_DN14400_c0_g1_i1.p1 TRINITY_DN14400_c0_g1~~TRINITY_DN14400_c0_g1_i1.p1  ORF type:complete len:319 (+),score=33.74 TRINITY_DN14400_c0_g1_i1:46-1002(+)